MLHQISTYINWFILHMHVFMPYTNNMSKSSKCARISQTLQMDTWKPSSTNKRIMSTQPREKKEKFEPILRSSPTLWLDYWSPKSLSIHVTFQLWTSQVKNLPAAGSCAWHGNAGISCSRTQGYRLAQCGKTSGIWGRQLYPSDLCKMCPCNAWLNYNRAYNGCIVGVEKSNITVPSWNCQTQLLVRQFFVEIALLFGTLPVLGIWKRRLREAVVVGSDGCSSIQPSCEYQHHLTHWPAS